MTSPKSGTIVKLLANEEDTVTPGQDLFVLEPGEVSACTSFPSVMFLLGCWACVLIRVGGSFFSPSAEGGGPRRTEGGGLETQRTRSAARESGVKTRPARPHQGGGRSQKRVRA